MPYRFSKARGGPRPARSLNFYPPRSQMMMISHQQLSFAASTQGYFIPTGQYHSAYISPTQQYPVISGSAGLYPGTSEYPAYGYFPGQPSYTTSVQPVVMSLSRHRQQSPPPQQLLAHSYSPLRTERKQIRIRDPNQGGRDITDEIMSGVMWPNTYSTVAESFIERACPAQPSDKVTDPDGNLLHVCQEGASLPADEEAAGEASQQLKLILSPAAASEVNSPTAQGNHFPQVHISQPDSGTSLPDNEGSAVNDAPDCPFALRSLQEALVKMEEQMEFAVAARPLEKQEEKIEDPESTATEPCQPPAPELEPAQLQIWCGPTVISKCEPVGTQAETVKHHLTNGLHQEEIAPSDPLPLDRTVETTTLVETAIPAQEINKEKKDYFLSETANRIQAATFVQKRKRNLKDVNKREAMGDLLDAFIEQEQGSKPSNHWSSQADLVSDPVRFAYDPWVQKEGEQNLEPNGDEVLPGPNEQQEQLNLVEKKLYKRDFLLSLQFISPSLKKPDGLPRICGVVLEKVNKTPIQHADSSRPISICPDFTPLYLGNLGGRSMGGPRGLPPWPRSTNQSQCNEPRKIICSLSLNGDVQLNKAEKAWKPSPKKPTSCHDDGEGEDDPEQVKSQQLLKRLRSILNKLTPEKFQELTKQVKELTIDTEERLKGAIDLIFEKAILEPNFCVAYANMCRCLKGLKLPTSEKTNFGKLLLNRCQKEFEKDQDDAIFEKKQKELQSVKDDVERERLMVELDEAKEKARRRSLGNIRFIGELFNLKMLTLPIMHDCVMKLLKERDEESMECLCMLLSTSGRNLDLKKTKPHVDQYFYQMEKIIKEGKTSSRIRFLLQDIIDLRKNNWVPRRGDQGPKTIEQIHKEAKMEEQREQVMVQQQLLFKKEAVCRPSGDMSGRNPHTLGSNRIPQQQDETLNTVTKNRPIDVTHSKISALEFNNVPLAPGVKCTWGSWDKECLPQGGETKPGSGDQNYGHSQCSSSNSSGLQECGLSLSSVESDQDPQRSCFNCEHGGDKDRGDRGRHRFQRFYQCKGRQGRDERISHNQNSKRIFIRTLQETEERARDILESTEPVETATCMTKQQERASNDIGSGDRSPRRDHIAKHRCFSTSNSSPALSEEEVERKSNAIIGEYLLINDLKEALQCVAELRSPSLLYIFVRNGIELTLEHSTVARERVGVLLHHLVKAGTLPTEQYYKGVEEILEDAEDMAIDIPHFWLYLAELIMPMIDNNGIPMGQLLREICKTLVPQNQAGKMLVKIIKVLCKKMTPEKVGSMWTEAGLNWSDFLPKDLDINKFLTDQKVDFTVGGETKPSNSLHR